MNASLARALAAASAEGRDVLYEHELLDALAEAGRRVPGHAFVAADGAGTPAALAAVGTGPAVVKVVSPVILHKTDVGGVAFVDALDAASLDGARAMILGRLPGDLRGGVAGFVVEERVPFVGGLGRELIVGLRQSGEFGPVVTVGFGGTAVEALSEALRPNQGSVLLAPGLTDGPRLTERLEGALFFRWLTGGVRGVPALQAPEQARADLEGWFAALDSLRAQVEAAGRSVSEIELNPLVWHGGWLPVDALLRLGPPRVTPRPLPLAHLGAAMAPASVALVGVSPKGMNIGRIILRVMLDNGYPAAQACVVREDVPEIDGVRAVPSLDALGEPVDLLVLAIGAEGVPDVLEDVFAHHRARAVLLIPGGMGETEGGKGIAARVEALLDAHAADPARPVLIGNNSLGLVSRPARFDSLFIPRTKLPRAEGRGPGIALISQSGAYMITRLTKLDYLAPAHQVSLGNQVDARFSHVVEALAADPSIHTFALYVEGFQDRDGARLAAQIRTLVDQGRDVIVYKGGRSRLGQAATAGHTASIAGDYRVFEELMHDVGAFVAGSFPEFVELTRLSSTLAGKRFAGRRVGLLSNAGYETVGMADNHAGARHDLEPARFCQATVDRVAEVLEQARIRRLITIANPLDITPMASDAVHVGCIQAILDDPGVDAGVFGNVPLTPNVQSLPRGLDPRDVFDAPQGYARRVVEIFHATDKPFVVVIDAGRHYDDMVGLLQGEGVPVFRSADTAIVTFGRYVERKLRGQPA